MTAPRQSASGFTLIELMIVVAIVAVLAVIALPAYTEQVRKSRRADAITRIAQVQQAQERWRANCPAYTPSLTNPKPADETEVCLTTRGLGLPAGGGYYTLSVVPPGIPASAPFFYDVVAQASGAQAGDTNCAFLRSRYDRGTITVASGSTSAVGNAAAVNNRCWNR